MTRETFADLVFPRLPVTMPLPPLNYFPPPADHTTPTLPPPANRRHVTLPRPHHAYASAQPPTRAHPLPYARAHSHSFNRTANLPASLPQFSGPTLFPNISPKPVIVSNTFQMSGVGTVNGVKVSREYTQVAEQRYLKLI